MGSLQLAGIVFVILGPSHSLRVEEHHLVGSVMTIDLAPEPIHGALGVVVLIEG